MQPAGRLSFAELKAMQSLLKGLVWMGDVTFQPYFCHLNLMGCFCVFQVVLSFLFRFVSSHCSYVKTPKRNGNLFAIKYGRQLKKKKKDKGSRQSLTKVWPFGADCFRSYCLAS